MRAQRIQRATMHNHLCSVHAPLLCHGGQSQIREGAEGIPQCAKDTIDEGFNHSRGLRVLTLGCFACLISEPSNVGIRNSGIGGKADKCLERLRSLRAFE